MSKVFNSITELIGATATALLVAGYGGKTVYISAQPFIDLIGPDASLALGSQYAGYVVRVPMGVALIRKSRNEDILSLLARGATARQVAREYRLTASAVWRVRRETIAAPKAAPPTGKQVSSRT